VETLKILSLYRELARVYDEIYGEGQRLKYWLISSQAGTRVADAGCGTGIAFEVLRDSYVVCLDISLDMLKLAARRAREHALGDIVAGNYWQPPLRPRSFDSVLFISSLEPRLLDVAVERWREVARRLVCEFRGAWTVRELQQPKGY
jgi:ubiquinone/menaquinone biosynthesis C-methylase UbiE